ncbi:MAG TPA: error-prone DNA polymerase [Castellaniella sp.]|uniref:error-prone DNA polymerase n=1 Tax=Castellaniella sp. TaxID=1955812 RepID=UPI002F12D706
MLLPDYIELDCLSNYTFLTGASHPDELIDRASTLGYAGLALSDECSLAGVVRAWEATQGRPFHLLIGSRFRLADEPGWTLIVLAQDRMGYGHLARLITLARRHSEKGHYRLTLQSLIAPEASQSDLAGLPGCLFILRPDAESDARGCEPALQALQAVAGNRLWLGLHLRQEDHDAAHLQTLRALSRRHQVPLVALGAVEMHLRSRQPVHDSLCALRWNLPLAGCGQRLHQNTEHALRSRLRLARLYPQDTLAETLRVAHQCTFELGTLRYQYPQETVPEGMTPSSYLRAECLAGALNRYPGEIPDAVRRQLDTELDLVQELHYEPYFLTVYDLVRHARQRGILCQGRGSAANSLICYCLGITEVDPLASNLLFARFISRERGEPPDIDVDFEHQRREEIIQYIYRRYGRHRAALTAVVTRYRHRSALRDAGRALGIAGSTIEQAGKLLRRIHDPHEILTLLQTLCDPERAGLWAGLQQALIGFPRHLSQHPGGFVIAQDRLDTLVPLENAAMPDRTVIQWDKDDLDIMGLLKVDVLALGMLTALRLCEPLVAHRHQRPWTLACVPPHDSKTFAMIQAADTVGVFQIESRAQMSMLPRLRPTCFYDLVIQIAIVRPGPMQGGMVHPYLRRRQKLEAVDYPSPDVRQILERTLGIPIFQEQAMKLAIAAAGFSPGEADQLRRAMAAWRRTGTVSAFHDRLRTGMLARGYTQDYIDRLSQQLEGFGEYGFPESHAASFARLAWLSAWLKCHEPEAYLVAMLNAQPLGFYSPDQLIQDARRHGVRVLPVCVQHSRVAAALEDPAHSSACTESARPAVRLGLTQIVGLSATAAQAIAVASHPFVDMEDLRIRARLSTRDLQHLARANALRALVGERRTGQWQASLQHAPGLLHEAPIYESQNADLPALSPSEHTLADYAALGLTLSRHPLSFLRSELTQRGFRTAATLLADFPDRRLARACGLVVSRQRPRTAHGIVFVTLEDETGSANVIVSALEAEANRAALWHASLLGVYGVWQRQQEICHLKARRLVDLSPLLGALRTHAHEQ